MDVSIICVNWNSLDYLRGCIPSIYKFTSDCSFEIIVVDNASPEGGVEALTVEFPKVKLIKSDRNLGFAGANNLGFQHATGEYVLFLNPDTVLNSAAIEIMIRHIRSLNDAGVMCCKLLNSDLSVQTSSLLNFPRVLNQLAQSEYLRLRWPNMWGIEALFADSSVPTPVDALSGACMLMHREVFQKVGMFSEDYFMYAEDLDLCYKTQKAGLRNYYVGDATIIHFGGKSSPSEWQTSMKLKSELRFCAIHYGGAYRRFFRYSLLINALIRLCVVSAASAFVRRASARAAMKSKSEKWKLTLRTLWQVSSFKQEIALPPVVGRSAGAP
jgi:GT2 family glycosyltransferase